MRKKMYIEIENFESIKNYTLQSLQSIAKLEKVNELFLGYYEEGESVYDEKYGLFYSSMDNKVVKKYYQYGYYMYPEVVDLSEDILTKVTASISFLLWELKFKSQVLE